MALRKSSTLRKSPVSAPVSPSDLTHLISRVIPSGQSLDDWKPELLSALQELQALRAATVNQRAGQEKAAATRRRQKLDDLHNTVTRERRNVDEQMGYARMAEGEKCREYVHVARCCNRRLVRALVELRQLRAQVAGGAR